MSKIKRLRPVHTPRVAARQRAATRVAAASMTLKLNWFNFSVILTNEIADFTYEYSFTHTREVFTYFLFSENLCTEQYGYVEKLIESVKKRTILYQSTRKHYKDVSKKDDAWKEVAEKVGEEVTGY